MATVNKDFRVKNGLVVEGTTATVNGETVITTGSDTDSLSEGSTNLYFTDGRVVTALGTTDTDSLSEGATNLYFTDQRAQDAVTNNLDTDDLSEGETNLYFTETRARDSLSGGTGITYTSGTGEIAADTTVLATKTYVDSVAEGLHAVPAAEALSDSNIAGTFNSGTNTITASSNVVFPSVDGVSLSQGDNILLTAQTNAWENGSYVLTDAGEAGVSPWVLTRCDFCDETDEIAGAYEFITGGTSYGNTGWVATVPSGFTLNATDGSGDITWVQFSGAGTYTAGTGLDLTGTEFSLNADTDDVSEGSTNLYFTDERAQDAVATAISNGTHTNITITYDDGANSISFTGSTPISDTDDVSEGSTNLYFTDQRAIDALAGEDISLSSVAFDSVAKTFTSSGTIASADVATTAYTFAHGTYRSAKLTVKFAYGTHTEISEVLLTMDTSDNIAITEYGVVQTNGSLGSVTAAVDGTDVDINVTVPNASTTATIFGTLIA